LMASAIGPGFITQTAKFTLELGANFACAILLRSISNLPQTRRASCCGS
jgi:Mn2+/Fe2+ NRAMP family transporter